MNIEEKILNVLEKIRPFLVNDGGDVEFIKFEEGIVYVKLTGHCAHCPMSSVTLKDGIESSLINEIPEVIEVVNVN